MTKFPLQIAAATIREYIMVTPTLAKVTCTIVKGAKKEVIAASVTRALNGAGSVVQSSFRMLDSTTAVGFVAASKEVRSISNPVQLASGYRVVSSNMYLDNTDKSLWELREGASGKYLARNGADNLESLVQACRQSPAGSIPRLNRVQVARPLRNELVAFVNQTTWVTSVDYGICLGFNDDGSMVVATETGRETVPSGQLVASYFDTELKPKSLKSSVFDSEIKSIKDYYRLAYGNENGLPGDAAQQAYVEKIMQQIDEMAAF